MNTTHGRITLTQTRSDWFRVEVDGHMVCQTQDHDEARRVANFCFKKTTPAADIIASYVVSKTRDLENAWGMVNQLLGMCADGCCGGHEMFEHDSPELAEWAAWSLALTTALKQQLKGIAA
jgi:hypothetical protein